ncbi:MAG: hypothetical protein K1W36_06715 [Lachnospiraceae bacterium]
MDTLNSVLSASSHLRALSGIETVPNGTDSGTLFKILKQYIEEFQNCLDAA